MVETIFHPATNYRLQLFVERPSHALALIGPQGIGRLSVSLWLISNLINIPRQKLSHYPYMHVISPVKNSISIDTIRDLNSFLKLKTVGDQSVRRFVVLEQAETMTIEAQNALLKSLEEPPGDTLIILTIENERAILPTILSRLQKIRILSPSKKYLQEFFSGELSSSLINQAYDMSNGLPGLMHALINDNKNHPFVLAVEKAKQILQAQTIFERLKLVDEISKQKGDSSMLLKAIKRISVLSLKQSAIKNNKTNLLRWQKTLNTTYQTETSLLNGASPKLALTYLMTHL